MKKTSLKDFWNFEHLEPEGVLHQSPGRSSIVFEIKGVDAMFYSATEWDSLASSWRSLLQLQPGEELQIIFSKTCDLNAVIDAKMNELQLAKNAAARALIRSRLNSIMADLDPKNPRYFSQTIYWVYTQTFGKSHTQEDRRLVLLQKQIEYQQLLSERGLRPRRLTGSALKALIMARANGHDYVSNADHVDDWPSVDILPTEVKVNTSTVRTLHLKTLPERFSQMGMMLSLTTIPSTFDLTIRIEAKDPRALYDRLDRKRRVLFGAFSRRKAGDLEADAKFQELNQVLSRLNASNDSLLSFGMTVCVRAQPGAESLQRWTINQFLQAQNRLGFMELSEPYLASFDCYLESIPTFRGFEICNQMLLSSNAVHFLPFYQTSTGSERPVCTYRTLDGQVFCLNPYEPSLANYNWLISGTSGSGKSFFVNSLILQSQSLNPRVFVVDVGGSYSKLTSFLEGQTIDFDARSEFALSPFFLPKSSDSLEESRRREHIQIVFWEMLRDEQKLPSIEERAILKEVLTPLFDAQILPKHPISDIRDRLESRGATRLALLLDRWCAPSFYGTFLDTSMSLTFESPMMTFDLKGLNDFGDLSRVVQLILCSSLWAMIRKDPREFSFVVLDEVAFTLLKAQPAFVDELISTVRKYNASVIVITQDLEKVSSNPAGGSILQNTQFKAILQQRGDPKNFAEPLNLNAEEIESIRRLQRKKGSYSDVFLMVDDRRSVIRYAPTLAEYLLSTSVPSENLKTQDLMNQKTGTYSERFFKVVGALSL